MAPNAKRAANFLKWSNPPESLKASQVVVGEIVDSLQNRKGHWAEVSPTIAAGLRKRGCEVTTRLIPRIEGQMTIKEKRAWARWPERHTDV